MAKYIVTNSDKNFVGIVESDAHKTVWENIPGGYSFITITDDNFTKLKSNQQEVASIDSSNNVTYTDLVSNNIIDHAWTKDNYQDEIDLFKTKAALFKDGHPDSDLKTSVNSFLTYLDSFDLDTITYPKTVDIYKHWEDNSVTYLNPLQIP